jgi:ribosomal protein S27AE
MEAKMRIIKYGNLPEYEFECPKCGCIFVAEFHDYATSETRDYITGKIYSSVVYVDCPECGQYNEKRLEEQKDD